MHIKNESLSWVLSFICIIGITYCGTELIYAKGSWALLNHASLIFIFQAFS